MRPAWDAKVRAMVERLKKLAPAPGSFELGPGVTVIDAARFHQTLLSEAESGPKGARSRTGAFQQDLERYMAFRGEKFDK